MLEKLEKLKELYDEIGQNLADPAVMKDMDNYKKLTKKWKELEPIIERYLSYDKICRTIAGNKDLIHDSKADSELREMAKEEMAELEAEEIRLEEELKLLLVPKDPNDDYNAIVEIRAGTGGDEAGIFAGDLYRMYTKFAANQDWSSELLDFNEAEKGGFKEIVFLVKGYGAYGKLKYESGVHRVQRVPDTEAQGRVHTSAASVAVLLETDEIEIDINENDLRIDVYRSGGNGGQSVNTTDSAVRITHLPSGVVVACQDERSQLKNKQKAMKILKAKLYDLELQKQQESQKIERASMVSTGDRSAKIRTYNFPQGRLTDHRINLTIYNLEKVMDGEISDVIEQLQIADRASKMANNSI